MSIVDRGTRRGSGLVPDCRYFSPSSSSEREAAEPSWEVITNQAIDQVYNKNRALRSKLTTRATKQVTIAAATAPRPKDHTYAKRPDFVTVKDQGTIVLLVCEVKIPWEHPLDGLAKLFEIGDEAPNDNVHEKFRKQLGQIVGYMQAMRLKHGYLTTYDQTVFLRMHKRKGNRTVQCSPIIPTSNGNAEPRPGFSNFGFLEVLFSLLHHCNQNNNYMEDRNQDLPMVMAKKLSNQATS